MKRSTSSRLLSCVLVLSMGIAPSLANASFGSAALAASGAALAKKKRKKKAPPTPVSADEKAVTPTRMNAHRKTLRRPAQADLDTGQYARAARRLERAAVAYGDPVLFLDAGDLWLYEARNKRAMEPVQRVIRSANIALDILFFVEHVSHVPPETQWKVVHVGQVTTLAYRAEGLLKQAEALASQIKGDVSGRVTAAQEQIRDEEAAAPPPPEPKPHKGMVGAGATMLTVGLVGVGVMATGIARGIARQNEIDDLQIPGQDQMAHKITQEGERANRTAYVGLGLALGGLLVGIPLLVVGQKRKKAAREGGYARLRVGPAIGGLTVQGQF